MRDCYVAEINRLGEDTSARDQQHVDDRLTEYLIILYIKAAFPDDVFELFWDTAPVRARQHAMWFLGVQLGVGWSSSSRGLVGGCCSAADFASGSANGHA
jgi:hypothetical protein